MVWLRPYRVRKHPGQCNTKGHPQIIAALAETAVIVRDIDACIRAAGGWPLK